MRGIRPLRWLQGLLHRLDAAPLACKSVTPTAAGLEPLHMSARNQAMFHFMAKSERSNAAVTERVRDWVMPAICLERFHLFLNRSYVELGAS